MFKNAYFSNIYSILCPLPQVVHIINVSAIFVNFRKEILAKIFAKTKHFAKTKNLTEFGSDTSCIEYVVSLFYITLHFGRIKWTYVCNVCKNLHKVCFEK
jgi:hypothetical protein